MTASGAGGGIGGAEFDYDFGRGFTASNSANNLMASSFTITVRDGDNCTLDIDTSLTVAPDAMPVIASLTTTNPSCGGVADGVITVTPAINSELGTNVANYMYNFGSGFGVNNSATNLISNSYTITVRDTNNCTFSIDTTLSELVLLPNAPLVATPKCFGEPNGSILFMTPNGQAPFLYELNNSNNFDTEGNVLTGLSEGTYTVRVQDANLCLSEPIIVPVTQPDILAVSLTPTEISCFGENDGTLEAMPTGGSSNFNYNWSNGDMTSVNNLVNLPPGDYTVEVEDGNGCKATSTSVTITEPDELVIGLSQVNPVQCFGQQNGSITVLPSGGNSPYTFSLDGIVFPYTTPVIEGLNAGDYNVVVKDSRGCEKTTMSINVDEPAEFLVTASIDNEVTKLGIPIILTAEPNISGSNISYSWSTPDSIVCVNCQQFETIPPGSETFTVSAFDGNGCEATSSVSVAVSLDRPVYIPNIFSPNGDGIHDEFYIPFSSAMAEVEELRVFDRSGALVFEALDVKEGEELIKSWNGEYNGTKIRQGVFVVTAIIKFVDGKEFPYQADLTLISSQ